MKIRTFFWKLHQWLGALSCVGLLMWAGSGLLHPIMARTQPVPAQRNAPVQRIDLQHALPLAAALQQQGIAQITQAELTSIDGQSYYRVALPQQAQAQYLHTQTGMVLAGGDARYAEQLARHYTQAAHTPVRSLRLQTQFDADYLPVNKLLPVWRVEFVRDDGLRAFVDTSQARLAALSDQRQTALMRIFRMGHNWAFLDAAPKLQISLMVALLACLLFSALSGLYFYWRLAPSAQQRLQQRPLTRWHRRLGLLVSVMLLMAVGSGSYHLLHGWQAVRTAPTALPPPAFAPFSPAEMTEHSWMGVSAQALTQLGLARLGGQLVWMVQAAPSTATAAPSGPDTQVGQLAAAKTAAEHPGHEGHSAAPARNANAQQSPSMWVLDEHGMPIENGMAAIAQALALHHAQPSAALIKSRVEITRFNHEYGFFNKRLPVWRVALDDAAQTRLFVEPASGALALRMDASDAREGWSFSTLHKWHFIPWGADVRDALLALFALGNLLVAGLGLWLFIRRYFSG